MNKTVDKYFKEKALATLDFVFGGLIVIMLVLFLLRLLYILLAFIGIAIVAAIWVLWRSTRVSDSEIQELADRRPEEWQYPNRLSQGWEQCFYMLSKDLPKKQGIDGKLRTPKFTGLRYYFEESTITFEYFINDLFEEDMQIVNATVPRTSKAKIESESVMTPVGPRESAFLIIEAEKEYRIPVDMRDQTTDTLLAHLNE